MRKFLALIALAAAAPFLQAQEDSGPLDGTADMPASAAAPGDAAIADAEDREAAEAKVADIAESTDANALPEDAADAPAESQLRWTRPQLPLPADGVANVVVIPVHDVIGTTNKYVLRRALKTAIDQGAEVVVLDIDTPGGRGDVMLEMMDMLTRFEGRTIAYVNTEAISAGALIAAVADDIYYAPGGVTGAAAVVQGTGEDIPATLRQKINSYMDAKLRAMTEEHPRRADVLRAMMQEDYVLKDGDTVLKDAGSLLTLTASEAMKLYGEPPTPLFGSGIYGSVRDLAEAEYGRGNYELQEFEMTWSESFALFMEKIRPILLGVGMLMLVLEFYTPGFGFLGIGGLVLLGIVFLSNYTAGLAGHEPLILFGLGFLLVMVELLVVPGVFVLASVGLILMAGSLIWSLADVWPVDGGGVTVEWGSVGAAVGQVGSGLLIAIVLFILLYKFLPRSLVFDRLVLQRAVVGGTGAEVIASGATTAALPPVGAKGIAVTTLRPSGSIEVDGVRYEATLGVGLAHKGDSVVVTGHSSFHLLVDRVEG